MKTIITIFLICFTLLKVYSQDLHFLTDTTFDQMDWIQIGENINGEDSLDYSGWSVSLNDNGNVLAIGAIGNDGNGNWSGHVRVYENIDGNWTQKGSDIDGPSAEDESGTSVSLNSDGSVVAIGIPWKEHFEAGDGQGWARVYKFEDNEWTKMGNDMAGEWFLDFFGTSVSLSADGNIVAVGATDNYTGEGLLSAGHVRVFEFNGVQWIQIGEDIDGEVSWEFSGTSIGLSNDGSIVAIGAPENNEMGSYCGQVRVYRNVDGAWEKIGNSINGDTTNTRFGRSVSINSTGEFIVAGAFIANDQGRYSGHVRVFQNIGDNWIQVGNNIPGKDSLDYAGYSVSINDDGSIVAVGATQMYYNYPNTGYVSIYHYDNNNWVQIGDDIIGESIGDETGKSVSLSSDGLTVAIGAPYNNGNGTFSGNVRVFELQENSYIQTFYSKIGIFPNPTSNKIKINSTDITELEIYNSNGTKITCEYNIYDAHATVDLSNQPNGIYFIRITTNERIYVEKIIKL